MQNGLALEARTELTRVLAVPDLNPATQAMAHAALGAAEDRLDHDEAAVKHYRQAITLRAQDLVSLNNLANILLRRPELAVGQDEALDHRPPRGFRRCARGQRGKNPPARIGGRPRHPGIGLRAQGTNLGKPSPFTTQCWMFPELPESHLHLGLLFEADNNTSGALTHFEKTAKLADRSSQKLLAAEARWLMDRNAFKTNVEYALLLESDPDTALKRAEKCLEMARKSTPPPAQLALLMRLCPRVWNTPGIQNGKTTGIIMAADLAAQAAKDHPEQAKYRLLYAIGEETLGQSAWEADLNQALVRLCRQRRCPVGAAHARQPAAAGDLRQRRQPAAPSNPMAPDPGKLSRRERTVGHGPGFPTRCARLSCSRTAIAGRACRGPQVSGGTPEFGHRTAHGRRFADRPGPAGARRRPAGCLGCNPGKRHPPTAYGCLACSAAWAGQKRKSASWRKNPCGWTPLALPQRKYWATCAWPTRTTPRPPHSTPTSPPGWRQQRRSRQHVHCVNWAGRRMPKHPCKDGFAANPTDPWLLDAVLQAEPQGKARQAYFENAIASGMNRTWSTPSEKQWQLKVPGVAIHLKRIATTPPHNLPSTPLSTLLTLSGSSPYPSRPLPSAPAWQWRWPPRRWRARPRSDTASWTTRIRARCTGIPSPTWVASAIFLGLTAGVLFLHAWILASPMTWAP